MVSKLKLKSSRRQFLLGLMTSVAAMKTLAFSSSLAVANSKAIVFATWGGSWEKAWRKAWADPFTKKTNISVISASGNTLGKLQAMVDAQSVEWDIFEGNAQLSKIGVEKGLLEKLDYNVIDRSKIMQRDEFMSDYTIPQLIFGRVMVYNKNMTAKPDSWASLWDIEKHPGKRAFYNLADGGIIETALLADGVDPNKLYPLDVDRALKKLDEIRDHIIWYDSLPQSEQLMRGGQTTIGMLIDGRALNLKNSGANTEMVPQVSMLSWSVLGIPKGAPNKDAAMNFLNFVLNIEQQVSIAMEYYNGPVVPEAWKHIPEERQAVITGGPSMEGKAVFQSSEWWANNLEAATEKFQQWKLG